jgi:polyisoprenoid-binding protein YceI
LHMGISHSWGRFDNITGTIELDNQNPAKSTVGVTVKADSVDTGMPKRDEHLRNPDFFNARQFPEITFKSQSVRPSLQPGKLEVQGTLTLHGVSQPLTVMLSRTGGGKGPMGDSREGYETSFTIKRSEFGMNKLLEGVGDEVLLLVSLEVVQK